MELKKKANVKVNSDYVDQGKYKADQDKWYLS